MPILPEIVSNLVAATYYFAVVLNRDENDVILIDGNIYRLLNLSPQLKQ